MNVHSYRESCFLSTTIASSPLFKPVASNPLTWKLFQQFSRLQVFSSLFFTDLVNIIEANRSFENSLQIHPTEAPYN